MHHRDRATFDAEELAVVLSHYDLGVVESVTEFLRGSRRSPKVGVVSDRGKYLLKRRAADRAQPDRVRFCHRVQAHLAAAGFPVAGLVKTRDTGQTLLQRRDHVYELFEFVPGHAFGQSLAEARDGGDVLARFHQATADFVAPPSLPVPHGDYHQAAGVRTGLCGIARSLSAHDSFTGDDAELESLVEFLLDRYDQAAAAANDCGLGAWPQQIIHSDWHPGNLLFRKEKVVAVIDYDSVRLSRRLIDVANGALQFSILAGGDPITWPEELDQERFDGFLAGYESVRSLTGDERRAIPGLMAEALIAECVPPITRTGSVGRWAGFRVLQMVRRKLKWLAANGDRLTHLDE